jgi:hypothetical protein
MSKTKEITRKGSRDGEDREQNDCDVDSLDGLSHSSSPTPNENLKSINLSRELKSLPQPKKLLIPSTSFLHEDSQYVSFQGNANSSMLSQPNHRQREYQSMIQSKREVSFS